jgi:predicted kinase
MRNLIVTRGLPGSGKSHTLASLGLADLTLGADAIRLLLASPVLLPSGRMAIPAENDRRVWAKIHEITGQRMARGETLVVDATHPAASDFKEYLRLARIHRYRIACIDFSGVPADVSQWHNDGRADYRQVPAHAVERISARMAAGTVPDGVHRITVRSNGSHLAETRAWLDVPVLDLDGYDEVVHIGDIQGCHTALMRVLGDGLRDGTFYIFTGDFCDRGEENGEAMRWLLDHAAGRRNTRFLWGNHENHLHREAIGLDPVSEEFRLRTLPQLRAAGVTPGDLDTFCGGLDDMVLYTFARRRVMVTHAGLSTVPSQPWMVPARQCAHGTGHYEDDVDSQFERNAPDGWTQVHGHRNSQLRETQATPRSFNLEAAVEAGGSLRAVRLGKDGSFLPAEAANPVFRPFRLRSHRRMDIIPPWMARETADGTSMAPGLRAAMDAHKGVRAKPSEAFPHVVSLNFTKAVFHDKAWDDVVVKARGLFINASTSEIVSRGYDKFFTVDEREDMTLDALRQRLAFPLTGYLKENGFLGNLGYDRQTDSLFIASKSTPDGEFAAIFREIFGDRMPDRGRREALKRHLRDTESCMTFEVIDPVRDPHMIEYGHPGIVLLDNIRRSTDFEKVPYAMLQEVGARFGLQVKQRALAFKDWQSFEGWYRKASKDMSRRLEGYVFEDAAGYQIKTKLPFYSLWKLCRGMKDQIVRERTVPGARPSRGLDHQFLESRGLGFTAPLADCFRDWCLGQDTATLQGDIIALRNAYEGLVPEPAAACAPGM